MNRNIKKDEPFLSSDADAVEAWFKKEFTLNFKGAVKSRFMLVDFGNGRYAYVFSQKRKRKAQERLFACRFAVLERAPFCLRRVKGDDLFFHFRVSAEDISRFRSKKPFYKKGEVVQGLPLASLIPLFVRIVRLRPVVTGEDMHCITPAREAVPYRALPWVAAGCPVPVPRRGFG